MRRGWASTARKRRWHAQARSRGSAEVAHRFTRQAAQESALPLHSGLKVRELLGAPRGYARGFDPAASRTRAHGLGRCHLSFPREVFFPFFFFPLFLLGFFFFFISSFSCLTSSAACLCGESAPKVVAVPR